MLPNMPSCIKITHKASKRETIEIEMIKKLIQSYFNVVKKNVNDSVPKTIVTLLVNQSKNICERDLISSLYKHDQFDHLLMEDTYLLKMREDTKKHIATIRNCIGVLNNIETKF